MLRAIKIAGRCKTQITTQNERNLLGRFHRGIVEGGSFVTFLRGTRGVAAFVPC